MMRQQYRDAQMGQRMQRSGGFTLVELLVTFLLLSIFITGGAMIMTSTVKVYYEAEAAKEGMAVYEMVFDSIAGELERARALESLTETGVTYVDRQGRESSLGLYQQDGGSYLEILHGTDGTETSSRWALEANAYGGYYIQSLSISQAPDEYRAGTLQVRIVLYNPWYGTYSREGFICCYEAQR